MCRTVYWSPDTGPVIPVDQWLGIVEHRFSPGVREMCCREALHCAFDVVGENLQRTAQVSMSSSTVREIVENQGRAALAAQQSGERLPVAAIPYLHDIDARHRFEQLSAEMR